LKRRDFIVGAGAGFAAFAAAPHFSFAANGNIDVLIGSDQNVVDLWNDTIVPIMGNALPDAGVTVTSIDGNSAIMALSDRALAALQTGNDPQMDIMEGLNPRNHVGGIEAGLWVDFSAAGLANYDKLIASAIDTPFGLPYRGSQVVLAYDSRKITDVPRNWADLTTWIKQNPGQFIYNRPDKGGSGNNFVRRAIHEANGRDPSAFTTDNFSPHKAEEMLRPAWDILKDLAPSLYQAGAYTAGNTPSLQLLMSGVVSMIPAWSDQALAGLKSGALPPHIKLAQLQDLAFVGGFAYCAIPVNAANREAAIKLVDMLLSPDVQEQVIDRIAGFPAIDWRHLSEATRSDNADVISTSIPTFPEGGDWEAAVNDGWYRNVASNIVRD